MVAFLPARFWSLALQDKIEDVLRVDGKHITQNQLLKLGRRHLLHADDPRRAT